MLHIRGGERKQFHAVTISAQTDGGGGCHPAGEHSGVIWRQNVCFVLCRHDVTDNSVFFSNNKKLEP